MSFVRREEWNQSLIERFADRIHVDRVFETSDW
jgi:hypothetical protein